MTDTTRLSSHSHHQDHGTTTTTTTSTAHHGTLTDPSVKQEHLLWSLLQVHSILCASVVERHVSEFSKSQAVLLPPLSTPDIDRAELQYLSTLNGFLSETPILCALLERERTRNNLELNDGAKSPHNDESSTHPFRRRPTPRSSEQKQQATPPASSSLLPSNEPADMDAAAYDMMMGNYSATAAPLFDAQEETDAAQVLNSATERLDERDRTDASAAAEALATLLQKRMRDLEAETCRRLIAWEDEKQYRSGGGGMRITSTSKTSNNNNDVSALSLSSLVFTLEEIDRELADMESWLEGRAQAIQPLTDDCREIEEENRQLEKHCRSYEALGQEMERLLQGLQLPDHLQKVLDDPFSVIPLEDFTVALKGVDLIYEAELELKKVLDRAECGGGMHLTAIHQQVTKLTTTQKSFCETLSMIALRIMEALATDIVERLGPLDKDEKHETMVKKIKETQKKFQASFLQYKRLLEVIAILKPENLAAIRKGYADLVQDTILSKKRMKFYFHSLPMKSCTGITSVSLDLKDYDPSHLKTSGSKKNLSGSSDGGDNSAELPSDSLKPVNSRDMEMVLNEMLPLVSVCLSNWYMCYLFHQGHMTAR